MAMRASVTVMAPPIRVEICANGISTMRLDAVRIATSPVPPWPLWQAVTISAQVRLEVKAEDGLEHPTVGFRGQPPPDARVQVHPRERAIENGIQDLALARQSTR